MGIQESDKRYITKAWLLRVTVRTLEHNMSSGRIERSGIASDGIKTGLVIDKQSMLNLSQGLMF